MLYFTDKNPIVHPNMLLIWSAMHLTFVSTARFAKKLISVRLFVMIVGIDKEPWLIEVVWACPM